LVCITAEYLKLLTDSQILFRQLLIANKSGIYGLYSLRSVQEYAKYYALGSGYRYALGALAALYDQNLSATEIAKKALLITAKLHQYTGEPVTTYTIKIR